MISRLQKNNILALASIILLLFALLLNIGEAYLFSIIFSLVSAFLFFIRNRNVHNQYLSLSLVFFFFSTLYGISGPLSLILGKNINVVSNDILWNNMKYYLVAFYLSSLAFILGIIIHEKFHKQTTSLEKIDEKVFDIRRIRTSAIITALLCTFFEIINVLRAGGFSILFLDKGQYQSIVANMSLTLPAETMYSICGIFLGMYIGIQKKLSNDNYKKTCLLVIIILIPYITFNVILGMRGALISFLITGVTSYSIFCPIKKISIKLIIMAIVVYIIMVIIFTNRGIIGLLQSDPNTFWKSFFTINRYLKNINPGNSEFGAPFINFCVFYNKYGVNVDYLLGKSYIVGLVVFIPSFLYYGNKPQQISYQFRDEFFQNLGLKSQISSTGFSSLLEAYWNWSWLGIVVVYFFIGVIISFLDAKKSNYKKVWVSASCIAVVSLSVSFSRKAMGGVLSDYFYMVVYSCICYFLTAIQSKTIIYKKNKGDN